jgi:hypothetical protein
MTDNTAFEGAYYKGHSLSEKLNDKVFRLHKTKRDGGFILHVIHIAGKRMKATGVDGLSRWDLSKGILAGVNLFSHLPFNLGAEERSKGVVGSWVRSWWRTKRGEDWGGAPPDRGDRGNHVQTQELRGSKTMVCAPSRDGDSAGIVL